jgi:hypothetical protein
VTRGDLHPDRDARTSPQFIFLRAGYSTQNEAFMGGVPCAKKDESFRVVRRWFLTFYSG